MNEADLARLALAKRAYLAAQPSEAEVQTGVRRARLALRRTKPRKRWLSKGLVLVVLAVGSLAYAKPHALGEWVAQVLERPGKGKALASGHGATAPAPVVATTTTPIAAPGAAPATTPAPTEDEATAAQATAAQATAAEALAVTATKPSHGAAARPNGANGNRADNASPSTSTQPAQPDAVSEWGRVGQALARGDEQAALAGLGELSTSDDPRTRDKADLGRAQLLLGHGNLDDACALARSLTRRHAGERIERQARALLKSCGR
jgi:hypothetical protein